MQIQGHRIKLLEGLLADIAKSKLSFSMATACCKILGQMQQSHLLKAVPAGTHCPVCVGTLIVVPGWGEDMGFASLRNAVHIATDVSYVQPPSPPTTGARASTNMPHAHARPCACCSLPVVGLLVVTVDCEFTISFTG